MHYEQHKHKHNLDEYQPTPRHSHNGHNSPRIDIKDTRKHHSKNSQGRAYQFNETIDAQDEHGGYVSSSPLSGRLDFSVGITRMNGDVHSVYLLHEQSLLEHFDALHTLISENQSRIKKLTALLEANSFVTKNHRDNNLIL